MPTSQSASERLLAASASGNNSLSARSLAKPSRIDWGVIDCNHRRSIGFFECACCTIERLWLQSMTPQSIRDGFAKLRADKELLPLADAAKSRSEADWLVGINGTRAMTAFNSKEGGFYLA